MSFWFRTDPWQPRLYSMKLFCNDIINLTLNGKEHLYFYYAYVFLEHNKICLVCIEEQY